MNVSQLKLPAVLMFLALLAGCEHSSSGDSMLSNDEIQGSETIDDVIMIMEDDFVTHAYFLDENTDPLPVEDIVLVKPESEENSHRRSILAL